MNRRIALCALAAALFAPHAGADPLPNMVQVYVNPNSSGGSGPFGQTIQLPGTLDLSGSATGGGNSGGSGTAHVEYGLIRLSGDAVGTLSTVTRGSMRDRFTITAPGVPTGTFGTLKFIVTIAGSLSAPLGSSAASWQFQGDIGGGVYDITKSGSIHSPSLGGHYTGDALGTYTSATVSFQFGVQTSLGMELTASAQAGFGNNGEHGVASISPPITLTWEGLSDIRVNGTPVGGSTVSSESGTNWATNVSNCPADFNGDGSVDFFDYDDFVMCFEGGACPPGPPPKSADFNNDTGVDFFDYDDFVTAFETPC